MINEEETNEWPRDRRGQADRLPEDEAEGGTQQPPTHPTSYRQDAEESEGRQVPPYPYQQPQYPPPFPQQPRGPQYQQEPYREQYRQSPYPPHYSQQPYPPPNPHRSYGAPYQQQPYGAPYPYYPYANQMMPGQFPPQWSINWAEIPKEQGWLWVFFSFNGRLERGRYIFGSLLLIGTIITLWLGGLYWMGKLNDDDIFQLFLMLAGISLIFVWPVTALSMKRLRDMDEEPWLALLFVLLPLIPCVGGIGTLVMWFWMMIERGTIGPNKYGPQPQYPPHEASQASTYEVPQPQDQPQGRPKKLCPNCNSTCQYSKDYNDYYCWECKEYFW